MDKNKAKKIKEKLKKFNKKYELPAYITIGIMVFLLCIMLAAQMKSISNTEEVAEGKREAELIDELTNLKAKYDDLKEKYDEKNKVVEEYQTNASSNDTLIKSMKEEIAQISILAGVKDLKGEGIIVTLEDGDADTADTESNSLVHDSDLLTVVNELKAAGAEAISVNDIRIISTSAIRCVGPVIQVNYQKVATPFVIKAIGNAQYLESALTIKNGVVDGLKQWGIKVNIERKKEIEVLKYDGTLNFKTATLAE